MYNFEKINLEKGMYKNSNKSFTNVLEELDPSSLYKGTECENLDAFQRQLKRFDIKVSGVGSDMVEKFFQTTQSASLFPEYIARAVRQGMEEDNLVPSIVATTTNIEGLDYRTITSIPSNDEKELKYVAEGSAIPETVVKTQDNLVKLYKRGRMLVASYEAIRFQRLDLFTVTLKQIGSYIAKTQLSDAIEVILNGDGNNNGATVIDVTTANTLTYADLLKLWASFTTYEMNTMLVSPTMMEKILNLSEFKSPSNGFDFITTGQLKTPFGANIIKCPTLDSDKIIGLDRRCALELVQAGDVVIEHDKLIDRQLERSTITAITGFAKIFPEAVKVLEL